jgi:hypothetical protein
MGYAHPEYKRACAPKDREAEAPESSNVDARADGSDLLVSGDRHDKERDLRAFGG